MVKWDGVLNAYHRHWINLSRGVGCADHTGRHVQYMRLQSTWCEQRRWDDILWTIPTGFYVDISDGSGNVVVHDQSERQRTPRALWQGLRFVEIACCKSWGYKIPELVEANNSRGGKAMDQYLLGVWDWEISDRTKTLLGYYKKFTIAPPQIMYCDGRGIK